MTPDAHLDLDNASSYLRECEKVFGQISAIVRCAERYAADEARPAEVRLEVISDVFGAVQHLSTGLGELAGLWADETRPGEGQP